MTKIVSDTNCGNSPKSAFIESFNIAFAKADISYILDHVTNDISWNIVGDKIIEGVENFSAELEQMKSFKTVELFIDKIITHGKTGSANGVITSEHGKKHAFADFYEFNNAKGSKIKSITSYVIEINKDGY